MSSFRGLDLFGSGPHRTVIARRGMYVVPYSVSTGNDVVPGARAYGDLELIVTVRGRLVASSEAGLWSLRQAVAGEAEFAEGSATLVDTRGRSFESMWLIRYEEFGAVDRGRAWSVVYEATFRKLTV
ncbi:MAG: hypothetical protein AAF297_06025 [Planctomycetota bacterium]